MSPVMANRRVRVTWSDLNGLAHGRYIPERLLEHHGHHAVTATTASAISMAVFSSQTVKS